MNVNNVTHSLLCMLAHRQIWLLKHIDERENLRIMKTVEMQTIIADLRFL